uniref:RNA polymerase-associated protein LEO1 n=1 Tax=Kalanchoe fedtschenkoi TaxID=63787 RepID=A0A7N0ZY05_KALFE
MGGEEKRHQMMQNLFGDQSEEEDEEEEIDSEHESNPQPAYNSDDAERGREHEGEAGVEGQGEAGVESEWGGDPNEVVPDPGESEGEREEVERGHQREDSDGKETDSEEKEEEYGRRVATSRRKAAVETGSDRSEENAYADDDDDEVDQAGRPPIEEEDQDNLDQSAPEIRDVFGDSEEEDEEEPAYVARNNREQDSDRSPMEDDGYGNELRPEDMLADEDEHYQSEEEHYDKKLKEKPVGTALLLDIPLRPPPATPDKMNIIKVSNIMSIDPKPFDPKTFQEDDVFVTDEGGSQKRIRLENNTVRWRIIKNRDGTESYESNARFVKWSDGSLQLLIGNEVLDISVQDAQHDQSHLFLRHGKGILQSQGRLLSKMRFMPSSLSSNSHRLLTALVDSRHKKVYKVKNCITDIDPEKEKEEKERALSQTLRANAILNRKREKVTRKYTPTERTRQLSPGFLEEALDEDDEPDYYDSRRSRRHYEEDLESEVRAEKRIMNAKKAQGHRPIPRKAPAPPKSSKRPVDFSDSERDESEYETDGDEYERSPPRKKRQEVREPEYDEEEYQDDEEEEEAEANASSDEAEKITSQAPRQRGSLKRKDIESEEESPPRKGNSSHRRKALVYDSDED